MTYGHCSLRQHHIIWLLIRQRTISSSTILPNLQQMPCPWQSVNKGVCTNRPFKRSCSDNVTQGQKHPPKTSPKKHNPFAWTPAKNDTHLQSIIVKKTPIIHRILRWLSSTGLYLAAPPHPSSHLMHNSSSKESTVDSIQQWSHNNSQPSAWLRSGNVWNRIMSTLKASPLSWPPPKIAYRETSPSLNTP